MTYISTCVDVKLIVISEFEAIRLLMNNCSMFVDNYVSGVVEDA